MKYFPLVAVLLLFTVTAYFLKSKKKSPPPPPQRIQEIPPPKPRIMPKVEEEVKIPQPEWTSWPRVREISQKELGKILQDIESHMPQGHHYKFPNKITWAHETTHGISSNIRNHFHQSDKKINAFYCLEDRGCIIEEPPTTLSKIAQNIPQPLRGEAYQLYLVHQRRDWNDWPLYLCDEWNAYTNGAECGKELNHEGWDYEILLAQEFVIYCLAAAMTAQEECPHYDHTQLKKFLLWNSERVNRLREGQERATQWNEKFKTIPEAEKLRNFSRIYFGPPLCKKVFNF